MKVVLVAVPVEAADSLASRLVDERLAACVQVLPSVRSVYCWEGRLEHADESLLVVKTSDDALARLMARVAQIHPYEVPEILALDAAQVHGPYAKWVDEETSGQS